MTARALGAALAWSAIAPVYCRAAEQAPFDNAYVLEPGLELEHLPSAVDGLPGYSADASTFPDAFAAPEELTAPHPNSTGERIVSLGPPPEFMGVQAPRAALRGYAYNPASSKTSWLIADGDRFGMVSLESFATLNVRQQHGLVTGLGVHFLDGPVVTDLPPRLFDLAIGYQRRAWVGPNAGYDVAVRVGAFSDFEGSAREGIRFPSHAVTFVRLTPMWQALLGVDYLDRDDVSLLPVAGFVWADGPMRLDLVFPRPRVAIRMADPTVWAYVRGELGGGTWAIERVDATYDNATYRDLRLAWGVECFHDEAMSSAIEVAYVFARDLSYRSGDGDYEPGDAVMLNIGHKY